MAKYILKKTRRQAAVKVTGTGQTTINIYELAYADQTITTANLVLTISDLVYDAASAGNIVRNGNVIYTFSPGQNTIKFSSELGVVLDEQANANVIVNLGSGESTVVIQFSKGDGYNDPNRQNQGPGVL